MRRVIKRLRLPLWDSDFALMRGAELGRLPSRDSHQPKRWVSWKGEG